MARTTRGAAMVDDLGASEQAKQRLKAILQTVSGERTIPEVCEELQIGEAMFHKLRNRFLEEAVMLLEPRTSGPKRKEQSPAEMEIDALRAEVKRAKLELEASRIRTEIALTMPEVLRRGVKKTASESSEPATRRQRRWQKRQEERAAKAVVKGPAQE